MTGSADLFAPRWDAGLPGGLAAGRPPAAGLNSASFLAQGPLAARVDALLPAEAGAGERATLGRTLLLAALLAQGAPAFAQDAVAAPDAARFVRVLLRLRARYAPLLAPAAGAPHELRWHGARPGALTPAPSPQRVPPPGTPSLVGLPGAAAALNTCLAQRLSARHCCAPALNGLHMASQSRPARVAERTRTTRLHLLSGKRSAEHAWRPTGAWAGREVSRAAAGDGGAPPLRAQAASPTGPAPAASTTRGCLRSRWPPTTGAPCSPRSTRTATS